MTEVCTQLNEGMGDSITRLPYAYLGPAGTGRLKSVPDDFVVEEDLGFELTGEGEHSYLKIEKIGQNTESVARSLAKFANVPRRDVSYAGLKDRHARTTQWFSVWLPKTKDKDWLAFNSEFVKILECRRHRRKLRKGAFAVNRFGIKVRELECNRERLIAIMGCIAQSGIPNYFGPQRFGRSGRNLYEAVALFQDRKRIKERHRRGLFLSAARSHVFNQILAARVDMGNWNQAISGDAMMLEGSRAYFKTDSVNEAIESRAAACEIHPTGALWGKGCSDVSEIVLALESRIGRANELMCQGLESFGVERARRSLRLMVRNFRWDFPDEHSLKVNFALRSGGFATSVLREMLNTET